MHLSTRLASALLCAALVLPVYAQEVVVPETATITAIEFKDVKAVDQKAVLSMMSVRVGDVLTAEARHRIGRELTMIGNGMTFSYRPGPRTGTAVLVLNLGC